MRMLILVTLLRDLIQREQFNTSVDSDLRLRLVDQKPKTLAEAAMLADQFVAVRIAERPASKGHDWKPKPTSESSRGKSGVGQHNSASANSTVKTQLESKPQNSETKLKPIVFFGGKSTKVICYYCKRPGHIMSPCRKRQTGKSRPVFHWASFYAA